MMMNSFRPPVSPPTPHYYTLRDAPQRLPSRARSSFSGVGRFSEGGCARDGDGLMFFSSVPRHESHTKRSRS
jgi:hypothetical protein